jgi:purine-cytosine permease-like protein
MNPRDWPVWLVALILVLVYAVGYLLQQRVSDGWDTVINLVGGAVVLVLGVTLADQLMSRRDGRWGSG